MLAGLVAGTGAIRMNWGSAFASAICAGVVLSFAMSMPAMAESLAGQVGEKRRGQVLPAAVRGPCGAAWKAYVAAPGHSAYASTRYAGPYVRNGIEAIYCGEHRNSSSKAAAEQRAIANCNAAKKKYKMRSTGQCEIVASK
jgi:hypothetical protein